MMKRRHPETPVCVVDGRPARADGESW